MAELDPLLAAALRGFGMTALALLWVIALVRLTGLRSLAKMSAFDFVTTIAVGSLIGTAGTSISLPALIQSLSAIVVLFAIQHGLAALRARSAFVARWLSNAPVLLMEDGRFIESALARTRVTRNDVYAKLREAGVTQIDEVKAIVLERTGDISIISDGLIDPPIMEEVLRLDDKTASGGYAAGG